jgi:hypothetical protein
LGLQGESRGVEVVWDHGKDVDGTGYDGIWPRHVENERVVETNPQSQDTGPGGRIGEQDEMGDVERDWKRKIVVGGGGCNVN